jgi:multidrug efflux pump subunit AcrA (membrane-fusion protein)
MTLQPATAHPLNPNPTTTPEPNGQGNGQASSPLTSSPLPAPSRLPRPRKWGRGARLLAAVAVLAVVGVAGGGSWLLFGGGNKNRTDLVLHTVKHENLQLTITERGQLESAENSEVVCRVKARSANSTIATIIRWVIDEGAEVKRGEKLVDLDDSGLYEQLKTQKITLDKAKADWVSSEEAYKIVMSQNESDLETARLNLDLARIALAQYVEGDYIQAKRDIEGRMVMANSDLEMWEERAAWSARMSKPGRRYVTAAQAQSDAARKVSAQIALDKVKEEMRVLEKYTAPKTTKELKGKVDEAERALGRTLKQAKAKEVQADVDRKSKQSIYEQESVRYADIETEIKKCVILSPQDGLVVYFVPEQSRFGSGSQQSIVAQGEPVREGQKLMRIPDLTKMMVNTRVHEAMVSRVRGEKWEKTGYSESVEAGMLLQPRAWDRLLYGRAFLGVRERFIEKNRDLEMRMVEGGQRAVVRVDAQADKPLAAHVKTVATVASQQDWLSADVKVYATMVSIDETLPGLKPGMSAEVKVFTDSHKEHVLTVPLQAILGSVEMGKKRKCFVMTPEGAQEREIELGLSNDQKAEVKSGLEEGEEVVLNPRVLLSDKAKAELGEGKGKAKGKGGPPGKDGKGKGGWPKDGKGKGGAPKGPSGGSV